MLRTIARTLGRTAVILIAAGIVVFAVWAVSNSSLASSLTPQGGPPAAVMAQQNQSGTSGEVVLADEESITDAQSASVQSADGSTTNTQSQGRMARQGRSFGEGGSRGEHGGGQGWGEILKNAGIILGVSVLVALIQTALRRIKRARRPLAPAAA